MSVNEFFVWKIERLGDVSIALKFRTHVLEKPADHVPSHQVAATASHQVAATARIQSSVMINRGMINAVRLSFLFANFNGVYALNHTSIYSVTTRGTYLMAERTGISSIQAQGHTSCSLHLLPRLAVGVMPFLFVTYTCAIL